MQESWLSNKLEKECSFQNCFLTETLFKTTNNKQANKIFVKCTKCLLLFNQNYEQDIYEANYFFQEYKNQYGLSYFEDKNNIQNQVKKRIHKIFKHTSKKNNYHLLEIGSAAGFALEVFHKELGISVEGWEISKKMSAYANKMGYHTKTGSFTTLNKQHIVQGKKFDIIAAFYVIEHLDMISSFWKSISNLLNQNGIFIFTVPSCFGPSYHFHKKKWENTHPKDHFVNYSIHSIKKIASKFNFKIIHASPDALHPERIWGGKYFPFKNIYNKIQKSFIFADTILVGLKKKKDL